MQLNYASIGPRTARKLGSSFVNGISYLALSSKYAYSAAVAPAISATGESVRGLLPEPKTKLYQPTPKEAPNKVSK